MKKSTIVIIGLLIVVVIGVILLTKNNNSEYYYEAEKNANMVNYDLSIINGDNLNGDLYSNDGEWLSTLKNGKAIINEGDIKDFPNYKIKVNDKTYVIKKK